MGRVCALPCLGSCPTGSLRKRGGWKGRCLSGWRVLVGFPLGRDSAGVGRAELPLWGRGLGESMCANGESYQRCSVGVVVCVGLCIRDSGCVYSLRMCVAGTMAFRSSKGKQEREARGIREKNDGMKGTREMRQNRNE